MGLAFNFAVVSGRDQRVRLPRAEAEDGTPLDLSGGVVRFGAQPAGSPPGTVDTLELTSEDGSIEILDQNADDLRGYADAVFKPETVAELEGGVFDGEVISIDATNQTHHVSFGTMTVLADVRD